jgi:hypothetical protein
MKIRSLLLVGGLFAFSVQAQTFVFNNGSSTTVTSPAGVTTINRNGNGYTVIGPRGVTLVNEFGNGNYNVIGPDGFTSVLSNGSGGYTIIGDADVIPIVPNGPAANGFTAIGNDGLTSELLPMGDGGLLLLGN